MARRSKQSIEAEQLILQTLKLMDIRVEAKSEGSILTIDFNPSSKKKTKPVAKKAAVKAKPGPKPKAKTAVKAKPGPKPKAKAAVKAKPGPKPKAKAAVKAKTTKAIAKKK